MNTVIIPARGGSKRIPKKNIRSFCGQPIITWSIRAARESKLFDRIIVSTDDEAIAAVAKSAGAEVPFVRPPELSDDHTPVIPVIRHAIEWLETEGEIPEFVCCLYPTAPFVTADALRESLIQLKADSGAAFVLSATAFNFPIFRALRKGNDGRHEMFWPEHELTRSQDLEPAYHDAGQFYWGRASAFTKYTGLFSAPGGLYLIPSYKTQDIDTLDDWERAELAFKILNPELCDE